MRTLVSSRDNGAPKRSSPRMCDKYIIYVYMCLTKGKFYLTDQELLYVFGSRDNAIFPALDPNWINAFFVRCRLVYEKYTTVCLENDRLMYANGYAFRARTHTNTVTYVDNKNRIVRITNYTDHAHRTKDLSNKEYDTFRNTTSVFQNAIFKKHESRNHENLALVLCQESTSHRDLCSSVSWTVRFFVCERDIQGLTVESDTVYTSDGISLYMMLSSWKTSVCFSFHENCKTDTIRTLCALVMGDTGLGRGYALKCNVPNGVQLDLRNVHPMKIDTVPLYAAPGETAVPHAKNTQLVASGVRKGLKCLEELIKVPCGFSIIAENELVLVLRHVLRDAVVIVPKSANPPPCVITSNPDPGPHVIGRMTEWFPCSYSSLTIDGAIDGLPPITVSTSRSNDIVSLCTVHKRCTVDTLRVISTDLCDSIIPIRGSGCSYAYEHSVCLLPDSMTIVTPSRLQIPSCIAVTYSVMVYRELSLDYDKHASTPTGLLFLSNKQVEASVDILTTYLSLSESFILPRGSAIELTVSSHACLMSLRKRLCANAQSRFEMPALHLKDTEAVLEPEMEESLLDIQKDIYHSDTNSEIEDAQMNTEDELDESNTEYRRESATTGTRLVTVGHRVLFGRGCNSGGFREVTVGIRTLGLRNLKILQACGLFASKREDRALLEIPKTRGVVPIPKWRGDKTVLSDDLCVIEHGSLDDQDSLCPSCQFQLNYSPSTALHKHPPQTTCSTDRGHVQMSKIEQAIASDAARGYEEPKLIRLFKSELAKLSERSLDFAADKRGQIIGSRFGPFKPGVGLCDAKTTIGDGVFFPSIAVAVDPTTVHDVDTLSHPLPEYKLHLRRRPVPACTVMARADRSAGECGSVYEACLDKAVLLGHGVRFSDTAGAKRNFDVSACLTHFYRAVHPCVTDMTVGDTMLDYEFAIHGKGQVHPIYALLNHLAHSCRVTCFLAYKLITLTRHRSSSAWTRGTEDVHSRVLRINTIGAFLCAQDHRLTPLLARCCHRTPLTSDELFRDNRLLPRGDEESLLLRVYSKTLGPVYEFETIDRYPVKVLTSLGEWRFLRLKDTSAKSIRTPGVCVVDGYTIAFAAESPLFHLKGTGPLVQRLESVAVIVDCSSLYRTDVLTNDTPNWPDPVYASERIKCKSKQRVIDEMFMRIGQRDPLDGASVTNESWTSVIQKKWSFVRSKNRKALDHEWETQYPTSYSMVKAGPEGARVTRWLCGEPPDRYSDSLLVESQLSGAFDSIQLDSTMVRTKDPMAWRGFDILCSRVITCPFEKLWSTGLCRVTNHGLDTYNEKSQVPLAHLITVIEPDRWYARPVECGQSIEEANDIVSEEQVSTAPELNHALARVMLSDKVHEDLHVKCHVNGIYAYIQRTIAWFARASGPFRSRNVTVFTPEAAGETRTWTHTLPAGVDVLKSNKKCYIVSCKPGCYERPDVKAVLDSSACIERVTDFGNLVLHPDSTSLHLSKLQGEAGVHVTVETLYHSRANGKDDLKRSEDTVYMLCTKSLQKFCESRVIPKGIRGPELWNKTTPWLTDNPSTFCLKIAELKYRWESGLEELALAPARESHAVQTEYTKKLGKWKRSTSDGRLIPKQARFWYSIDQSESFRRSSAHSRSSTGVSDDIVENESSVEEGSISGVIYDSVQLSCDWSNRGLVQSLTLDSCVTIRFVSSTPLCHGHVFFEPVRSSDHKHKVNLTADGALIRYYKPYNYANLTTDLFTVLVYGCGLTPVLASVDASDKAESKVLCLALCSLSIARRLARLTAPVSSTITVVVPGGLRDIFTLAREISCVAIATRSGVNNIVYSFNSLPEKLEDETGQWLEAESVHVWDRPSSFVSEKGVLVFSKLTQQWQELCNRGDVEHPTRSLDPRWIGLTLCLSEWLGYRSTADVLIPGAIECLLRTFPGAH